MYIICIYVCMYVYIYIHIYIYIYIYPCVSLRASARGSGRNRSWVHLALSEWRQKYWTRLAVNAGVRMGAQNGRTLAAEEAPLQAAIGMGQ